MTDCASCGNRLETLGGRMKPFCAVEECTNYDKKSTRQAERLLGPKNQTQ